MNRILIFAVALTATLGGCNKAPGKNNTKPTPPVTTTLTGVNKWIREQLEEWYYWRDALVASTPPSNSLAYDEFLEKSLINLSAARDADGTIDGHYNPDGSRRLYSYIERYDDATTRAELNKTYEMTYGLGIYPLAVERSYPTQYEFLVTWVLPDGPAAKAGVKRGTVLRKYKNSAMSAAIANSVIDLIYYTPSATVLNFVDTEGVEHSFGGENSRFTPILAADVITSAGGKKVAYLMYNSFRAGDQERAGGFGEFDEDVYDVFGEFKAAGATELVLDFRYNGGGYLTSSLLLSSLAGKVDGSQVFCKMYYNDHIPYENPETWPFLDAADVPNTLGLTKVYVLTTNSTASASEELINGLRGVDIEVVTIGATTNGKNTGMVGLTHTEDGYRYEMWPITFKSCNAKGFSEYSMGFDPTVAMDEIKAARNSPRGEVFDFGDPQERLLNAALTMIDGGTVTPDARTRAAESRFDMPADPRMVGTRVRLEEITR